MNYKKLVTLSPLIGTALIFMGIVKLQIYYSHFGLNIFDYLDFSEIITSFLDDINLFLLGAVLILIYAAVGSLLIVNVLKYLFSKVKKRPIGADKVERYIKKPMRTIPGLIAIFILTMALLVFSYSRLFCYLNIIWLYVFIMFFLQLILVLLERVTELSEDEKMTLSLIATIFLFVWISAQFEIARVETHSGKASIILDNDTLVTSHAQFMVGKTDKYLFIHEVEGKNIVIPVERLRQLTIEQNKD